MEEPLEWPNSGSTQLLARFGLPHPSPAQPTNQPLVQPELQV
ncbi:hypothetical protein HaLaN_32185, partial [Haematococcus lacustris]